MKSHGIEHKYAELSNTELDGIIMQFKSRHPESGLRYTMGFLQQRSLRVQYSRVIFTL